MRIRSQQIAGPFPLVKTQVARRPQAVARQSGIRMDASRFLSSPPQLAFRVHPEGITPRSSVILLQALGGRVGEGRPEFLYLPDGLKGSGLAKEVWARNHSALSGLPSGPEHELMRWQKLMEGLPQVLWENAHFLRNVLLEKKTDSVSCISISNSMVSILENVPTLKGQVSSLVNLVPNFGFSEQILSMGGEVARLANECRAVFDQSWVHHQEAFLNWHVPILFVIATRDEKVDLKKTAECIEKVRGRGTAGIQVLLIPTDHNINRREGNPPHLVPMYRLIHRFMDQPRAPLSLDASSPRNFHLVKPEEDILEAIKAHQ